MTDDPLTIVLLIACFGVLFVLLLGINAFRKSGADARKQSNKFMRWRIIAQFMAVLLVLGLIYLRRQSGG
jgi:hypothetical protein